MQYQMLLNNNQPKDKYIVQEFSYAYMNICYNIQSKEAGRCTYTKVNAFDSLQLIIFHLETSNVTQDVDLMDDKNATCACENTPPFVNCISRVSTNKSLDRGRVLLLVWALSNFIKPALQAIAELHI